MDLRIDQITDRTDRIREFRLVRSDGSALPAWSPGAHVEVDLGEIGARAYSLIDWACETETPSSYTIAVQREDPGDGGSRAMHAFSISDEISVSEPKQDFPLTQSTEPIYLLAGGIGITPLISMASTLLAEGRPFELHHACRSRSVAAYVDELCTTFAGAYHLHTDDSNPIDLEGIVRRAADANAHLFICGPKGMIDATRALAEGVGIAKERVHVELFATPRAESNSDSSFDVEIHDTGQVFTIPPGQNIISVLSAAGIDLIYDCQRGDCGICQVDVIDGIPDHRDVVLTDAEKAKNDVMQICVSRAKSPRLVLDI